MNFLPVYRGVILRLAAALFVLLRRLLRSAIRHP